MLCAASQAMAAKPEPICPDRPTKSTDPCTVPKGLVQIETGLIDWTHDRSDGQRSDLTAIAQSLVKYGLSDRADIELQITPLEILSERVVGEHHRVSGIGDTLLRVKYRLTEEDAAVEVALDPFVKLPTAKHDLGNRKVEGGVVVPVSAKLGDSKKLSLGLAPELDLRADEDGHGYHAAMLQVVNLGVSATDKLTLSGELWGEWDWDPSGTVRQASADGAIAYQVNDDLQLDAGGNFGLNRNTPDVELYTGVSIRF
jgi:hypothetical protein